MRSFVNIIATPKGGTHLQGFERGITKTFNEVLRTTRQLKQGDPDVIKEDILEGITAVVTVRLAEPQFEGQTKEVLGTPAVANRQPDRVAGTQGIPDVQQDRTEGQGPPGHAEGRRCVAHPVGGPSAAGHPAAQERPGVERAAGQARGLPSNDVERSELFIVEGDSALGTAKSARDSEFQALLPIRGKILNVQKASIGDMLKNAECSSIIQVVGAGSGRTFDVDAARYGRIIFMADADSDGAHIRCLLATLFFRYMRELVDAGRVYTAVPPLHRIELINPKRARRSTSTRTPTRSWSESSRSCQRKNIRWKDPVQRYKGLGEMDAGQLAETTMEPRHRTLRRLTVDDGEAAAEVFELLMGNEVPPRKEFIVQGAYEIDADMIDA